MRAAYGENLSKERSRELTLMAVERLLSTGRIEAGWPTAQGEWEPWRMSTRAVLTRIESEWSALNDEPNIGAEIVWFNRDYPVKAEIKQLLADLIAGRVTRQEAARWADEARLVADRREVTDLQSWRVLKKICSADAVAPDRPYLYLESDFYRWLAELDGGPT